MSRSRVLTAALAIAMAAPIGARGTVRDSLSLEARAACMARVEAVLASARGRGAPAPDAAVMRARALRVVRVSNALGRLWNSPVSAVGLRAELSRIQSRTKAPGLWARVLDAVGNDSFRAAECVARPLLAERAIQDAARYDARIHGATERAARSAIERARAGGDLSSLAPRANRIEYREGEEEGPARGDARAWNVPAARLEAMRRTMPTMPDASALTDDGTQFVLSLRIARTRRSLTVLRLAWPKRSFDSWWSEVGPSMGESLDDEPEATAGSAFVSGSDTCPAGSWTPIAPGPPDPRKWHSMIWTGREAIVWGGWSSALGGSTATGARYDTLTDTWTPTSTTGAPDARFSHVAAWTGTEMFVWGGQKGIPAQPMSQQGALYNPSTDSWRAISTVGSPPGGLGSSALWTGTHVIVMGSDSSTTVYLYDPVADRWSHSTAPRPMRNHRVVWTGSRMLAWGGTNSGLVPNPVGLSFDPSANSWTTLPPAPITPRVLHSLVWTGSEMIVWGGGTYETATARAPGTGAAYNPATGLWRLLPVVGAPAARTFHVATWSAGRMVVWGGRSGLGLGEPYSFQEGARYDPVTDAWEPVRPFAFTAGGGTMEATAVSTGDSMIVWGGEHGQVDQAIGGRYDPASDTWSAIGLASAPSGRGTHRPVWTGTELIVWGGGAGYPTGDGRRYLPVFDTWLPLPMDGAPSPRDVHEAVWTGREMIVWSGFTEAWAAGGTLPRSGARYDPAADRWRPMTAAGAPSGRFWAASAWTGTEMIVWGGYDGADLGTGGRYDPQTDTWRATSVAGAPPSRSEHELVWTGDRAIVWGGYPATNTGSRYDPSSNTWSATSPAGAPAARFRFSAVSMNGQMIVWGGYGSRFFDDGGTYDPALDTWTGVPAAPYGAYMHRASVAGEAMIVWGGYSGAVHGRGAIYDPNAGTWQPTPIGGGPTPRYFHAQAWTGEGLLVWGGNPIQGSGAILCRPV